MDSDFWPLGFSFSSSASLESLALSLDELEEHEEPELEDELSVGAGWDEGNWEGVVPASGCWDL